MSNLLKSKFILGALVAVVAVFGFSTVNAAYVHSTTLKMGSTGSQVMSLQQTLNMTACKVAVSGIGSMGMESSYFGGLSKAAVMCFQAANGLTADGVVGPMTGAKLAMVTGSTNTTPTAGCPAGALFNSMTGDPCGTTTPTTPTTLEGLNGEISDINQLSQYSGEEVGEGSSDVKVLGFEVEASNDGDIKLNSIKLTFDSTGNGSGDSDRIADYLDKVTVMMGSEEIGSADLADFNKDDTGIYSKTIQLTGAVIESDTTEKFYVAVDGAGTFDSGDIDSDSWTIAINNIKFEDGSGVITTTDSADSLLTGNMDYDAAGDGVDVSFVTFSSASDTELKISTNNTPESATVEVDASNNTDEVSMLKGKIKLDGDSDVWLDELPVTLTATGDSPVATTGNVTLVIDGQTFNETVTTSNASTATITFDNLDLDISAGDTINFEVSADINDIENTGAATTDFDEGDQLTISLTTTNRAAIIAENEQGDQLTDSTEMTGSATGNAMTFRSEGVNVVMGTPTYSNVSDQNGVVTQQTFTIPVTVTAFGDTLYMGQSGQFATTATASNAFAVVFENSSTPTTADVTSSASIALSTTNALIESNGFVLDEGEAKNFIIEVTQTTPGLLGAITAGNYRVRLDDIRYFTGAGLESTATATSTDLTPTSEFRTSFKYITS